MIHLLNPFIRCEIVFGRSAHDARGDAGETMKPFASFRVFRRLFLCEMQSASWCLILVVAGARVGCVSNSISESVGRCPLLLPLVQLESGKSVIHIP